MARARGWLAAVRGQPCSVSRRCCVSTTIGCSTSTGTGARRSRCATTCWRCRCPEPDSRPARLRATFPAGLRRAARSGRNRAGAGGHGADRRTGHRQDHHGRAAAGAAGRAGELRARRGRGSRWRRRPARRRPGCRRRCSHEVAKLDAADRARLAGLQATTLHRLLGSRPDTSSRFRHNRGNRLPHDVIVVDETSMVSLTMMARLLEAVRPDARLILVGDPDQLASVEAGAVLADLVDGLSARADVRVAALRTSHRFGESIGALAEAIRVGDARPGAGAAAGRRRAHRVDRGRRPDRTIACCAVAACAAAARGGVARGRRRWRWRRWTSTGCCARTARARTACGTGTGRSSAGSSEETGEPVWSAWYAGRPLLVTANDYGLRHLQRRHRCRRRPRRRLAGRDRRRRPGRWTSRPAGSPTSRPCTR